MSAASRAFQLGEIVTLVVDSIYDDSGDPNEPLTLSYALVNSQWYAAGIPHLWTRCGGSRPQVPRVRHLVSMSPTRRQFHADFIQQITFGFEDDWKDRPTGLINIEVDSMNLWEGRFYPELVNVQFPRIETLTFQSPSCQSPENSIITATGYLCPSLKCIIFEDYDLMACARRLGYIWRPGQHPEDLSAFLVAAQSRCPNLEELRLYHRINGLRSISPHQ